MVNNREWAKVVCEVIDLRNALQPFLGNVFKCVLLTGQEIPERVIVQILGKFRARG